MAQVRIDASQFSPDTREFIQLLHDHGARYVIVGGEAVIFDGYARLTGDVDFFFDREPANLERFFGALDAFWNGDVPGLASGLDALVKNKRSVGRPKDLDDLDYLEDQT